MNERRDAYLVLFIRTMLKAGCRCGAPTIQKTLYCLQVLQPPEEEVAFNYFSHTSGPLSNEVERAICRMIVAGVLRPIKTEETRTYTLGPKAESFLARHGNGLQTCIPYMELIATEIGKKTLVYIAIMSHIAALFRRGFRPSSPQMQTRMQELFPSVIDEDIRNALIHFIRLQAKARMLVNSSAENSSITNPADH